MQRLGKLFQLVDEAMRQGKTAKARLLLDEVQVALRAARETQGDGSPAPAEPVEATDDSRVRRISTREVAAAKVRAQRHR